MRILRSYSLILVFAYIFPVFFFIAFVSAQCAAEDGQEQEIVEAAEGFFLFLRGGDFKGAWGLLSAQSRKYIIDDVHRASKKLGQEMKKQAITEDFENHGPIFNDYWSAFARNFDSDMVLEKCVWKMGKIGKERASIFLVADNAAELKMYREGGGWRVGLAESLLKGLARRL